MMRYTRTLAVRITVVAKDQEDADAAFRRWSDALSHELPDAYPNGHVAVADPAYPSPSRGLPEDLFATVRDIASAEAFIRALHREGLLWHFDDDPADSLRGVVSRRDATWLDVQRRALFVYLDDPHELALALHNGEA